LAQLCTIVTMPRSQHQQHRWLQEPILNTWCWVQ
jgi:hypothetical protein